jgi:antitoxin component of MazEF toxin-antitoxin module
MVKVISKIGNSQGLIMDQALLELLHLRVGDQVNIEVHDGGTATLTPLEARPSRQDISKAVASVVKDYAKTLRRLA